MLDQDYPSIEYVVMDGGSTDATERILEPYRTRLHFVSQPDNGQADAINRGVARTRGTIVGFLNADDTYLPGAVSAAVEGFAAHPDAAVVYGDAIYIDEDDQRLAPYPVESFERARLARRCIICQPAAFIRRDALAAVGGLDAMLRFALDYDLWIRLAERYPMVRIERPLAASRLHGNAKTIKETAQAMRETMAVLKRHYGYVPFNWVYGYAHHRVTGQPIAIDAPRRSIISACYSATLGVRLNWRHPLKYCADMVTSARQPLT